MPLTSLRDKYPGILVRHSSLTAPTKFVPLSLKYSIGTPRPNVGRQSESTKNDGVNDVRSYAQLFLHDWYGRREFRQFEAARLKASIVS